MNGGVSQERFFQPLEINTTYWLVGSPKERIILVVEAK